MIAIHPLTEGGGGLLARKDKTFILKVWELFLLYVLNLISQIVNLNFKTKMRK